LRRTVRPLFALGLSLALACALIALSGCERPGCENADLCVERCFTPIFRQCDGCPSFSFEVELCDRPTVCVREVDRPASTCDASVCTEGDNPRCIALDGTETCSYDECEADGDCAMGERCACSAGPYGAHLCVPATCSAPEDCGDFPCAPVPGCGGPYSVIDGAATALACHGPDDACYTDDQCPEGEFCALREGATTWACAAPFCE
jgi:hypothetical protein